MKQNAQAALEFLVVTFVVMLLLLLGVMLFAQYNSISEQLDSANSSLIECNKIAGAISQVYASRELAQKSVFVSKAVQIKRTGNAPGQITVGNYYCNYFGNAKTSTTTDIVGFPLTAGTRYTLARQADGTVLFS